MAEENKENELAYSSHYDLHQNHFLSVCWPLSEDPSKSVTTEDLILTLNAVISFRSKKYKGIKLILVRIIDGEPIFKTFYDDPFCTTMHSSCCICSDESFTEFVKEMLDAVFFKQNNFKIRSTF
jgi:hypothetical protein